MGASGWLWEENRNFVFFWGGNVLFHKLGEHFWEILFSYALFITYTNICNILGEFCFLMLHLLLKYTHMLLNKGELMIVDQRETSN